jgi:hypothetical protein
MSIKILLDRRDPLGAIAESHGTDFAVSSSVVARII